MDTLVRSLGSHGSNGKNSWIVAKIALVSLLVRAASIVVLVILPLSGLIDCFDCSSRLEYLPLTEGFVRWDTIHFIGITRREYLGWSHRTNGPVGGPARLEQDWAFGQGIIWIFRFTRAFLPCPRSMDGTPNQVLPASVIVWVSILASLASIGSSVILFLLTLELFGSIRFATLASVLHVFSPSPSTQAVPYTEPFYSFFSFAAIYGHALSRRPLLEHTGLRHLVKSRLKIFPWRVFIASLAASATAFRSIGVFQSLIWAWDWVEELKSLPSIVRRTKSWKKGLSIFIISSVETLTLGLITCGPFLYDQWLGYRQFCSTETSITRKSLRPWCQNRIPSIYNFVQTHYWDVGFLKYWTWNQSPLFLLSFPVYLVSLVGIFNYYRFKFASSGRSRDLRLKASHDLQKSKTDPGPNLPDQSSQRPFLNPRIEVYVHIQLVLTLLLLFNSHVQIILRQAATMPLIWWTVADGIGFEWNWWREGNQDDHPVRKPKLFTIRWTFWFKWLSIWFPISLILWSGFYPPA